MFLKGESIDDGTQSNRAENSFENDFILKKITKSIILRKEGVKFVAKYFYSFFIL